MLIDASKTESIPKELEQAIIEYLKNMSQEMIAVIKSRTVTYESDVRIAIEDYLNPFASDSYDL